MSSATPTSLSSRFVFSTLRVMPWCQSSCYMHRRHLRILLSAVTVVTHECVHRGTSDLNLTKLPLSLHSESVQICLGGTCTMLWV
eukprot:2244024-Amphidinium_carterae.1